MRGRIKTFDRLSQAHAKGSSGVLTAVTGGCSEGGTSDLSIRSMRAGNSKGDKMRATKALRSKRTLRPVSTIGGVPAVRIRRRVRLAWWSGPSADRTLAIASP